MFWNAVGYTDADWNGVVVDEAGRNAALIPKAHAAVRATGELTGPQCGRALCPGRFVFDVSVRTWCGGRVCTNR